MGCVTATGCDSVRTENERGNNYAAGPLFLLDTFLAPLSAATQALTRIRIALSVVAPE